MKWIVYLGLGVLWAPLPVCLAQQLEGHWELDDGSGSVASDSGIGAQDGTLVGPAWVTDTGDGSSFALEFDGVDDRLDLGSIDLDGGALTIAMWFKVDSFGTRDARLISKATGVQTQQHFWMLSTIFNGGEARLRFRLRTGGATSTLVASSGALTPGVWTHAAAVYDGSSMRIYKDGVEVGSRSKSGLVDAGPSVLVSVGHQPPGAGQQAFNGSIDDVRLYRSALSGAELLALISGGNQLPVALDDSYSLDMDDVLVVDASSGVLANDSDLDGDALTAQLASDVSHGALSLASDGSFTYTPVAGYSGTDFFTYRASDGTALSSVASVTLTVQPPAGADVLAHYRLDEGVGSTAADSAGSNDGLLAGPAWSADSADGSPYSLDFDGVDDRVDLGLLDLDSPGMTLACWLRLDGVQARDARLISKATGVQAAQHYWMLSTIFSGGVPTLRFRLKTSGSTATLIGTGGALSIGTWTHIAAVYDGAAMRLFQDGVEIGSLPKTGAIDVAPGVSVSLGSQPVGAGQQFLDGGLDDVRIYRRALSAAEIGALISGNQSPVAQDDGYMLDADTMLSVDAASGVLDNDTDAENDGLSALLVSDVSNGTLALGTDGSFTYTPLMGFAGVDEFMYRASDGNSVSGPARVTLTVISPSGSPPVAVDDAYFVQADTSLMVGAAAGVLDNDVDVDMDPLDAQLVSDVSHGVLSLALDGSFDYTPAAGFSGSDAFVYRAFDGFSLSNLASVSITVTGIPGDELEAHWRLDDGAGPVAVDSSGQGHVGSLNGPVWSNETTDGSPSALSFDGVDDRVDIGSFDLTGEAMTIACWIRPSGFSIRDARLVSKASGVQANDHYWMLSTIFSGGTPTLRFRLKTGGSTSTLIASSGALSAGVWTHAAAVYDGAFMRLYLDGVEVGSTPKSGAISANSGVSAAIGRQPAGAGNQPFAGLIDDVRIYTRALNEADIGGLISTGDPLPQVEFQMASQSVSEAGAPRAISVTLSQSSATNIPVPFAVSGSASPADYGLDASPLVIPAGQVSADILLTPLDDALVEPDETVVITLGAPGGATLGALTVHTLTLLDDDPPPIAIVSDDFNQCALSNVWTFTDPVGDGSFLTRGPGTDAAQLLLSIPAGVHDPFNVLGVPFVTQSVPDTDFELEVKFDSVLAGSIKAQGILILEDLQNWLRFDFYSQGTDLFLYSASTSAGVSTTEFTAGLGSSSGPTWMRVARVSDQWSVSWSSDGATFIPMASYGHALTVQQVGVFVGNSGPAHTAVFDYFLETSDPIPVEDGPVLGAPARTLTLSTTGSGSVMEDLVQAAYYCSETVTLTATPAPGWVFDRWEGALGGNSNPETVLMDASRLVTAVFTPDNNLPGVGLDLAAQDLSESALPTPITVSLSESSLQDVTVPYTLSGTATVTTDYAIASSPLVISAGQLSGAILLTALEDGLDEPDETVVITLGAPTNANQIGIGAHTATLLDIDPPTIQFDSASQQSGEGAGTISIGVTLSSVSPVDVSVPYSLTGTAASPDDYGIDASPLIVLAGQTVGSLTLTPVDDTLVESNETVVVTLGMPVGATLGGIAVHTATLVDDDTVPAVDFASAGQSLGEAVGMASVTVQLSHVAALDVTVPYVLTGSATSPEDFTSAPNPIVIVAGQLSANITLTVVDDGSEETSETIVLTLGAPSNAVQGATLVHTATIVDNDAAGIQSDDFSAANLRQDLWNFVDPLGDGTLQVVGTGTLDAQLLLSVPQGVAHEAWTPLNVPRVMQSIPDEDLDVVAKFESELTTAYQNDGLIFDQEDGLNWVRFDFRYNGSHLQAYASRTVNNSPATVLTSNISAGPWTNTSPLYMRITRTGDDWLYRYSFDGASWTTVGSFTQSLQLNAFGPFCGNAGVAQPAHTTVVDYVFNTLAPIAMEDFGTPVDTTEPFIYRMDAVTLSDTAVEITWESDELALGSVEYGTTTAYELGFFGATAPAAHMHTFLVTGLSAEVEYHFRINAEDPSMNLATPPDLSATTFPEGFTDGPSLTFWYGQDSGGVNNQSFGHLGEPQSWINLLGNVFDFTGSVASLSYRIGAGGTPRALSIGADVLWTGSSRLELPGDFNADIAPGDLSAGLNDVIFTAVDDEGNETTEICRVDYTPGVAWPQTYSIDWKTVTDIQDVVQVVDGEWSVEDDPYHAGEKVLRSSVPGYDRLVALGDPQWENYEVVLPYTANGFNPAGFNPISNSFALGLILRWPGHSGPEFEQPRPGFFPFGGLFAYRWFTSSERWDHYGTNFSPSLSTTTSPILIGVPSIMKARVQTQGDGSRLYQLRHWQEGQAEPAGWFFQSTHAPFTGTDGGSLLLVSNYMDVSFGNISVTPLP